MKRNWKRYVPGSTLEAVRACKDYAIERHGLSVERIADRLGVSADLLYKWLTNGQMHATLIPAYEGICGCHFISDHFTHAHGKLAVLIPAGRDLDDEDLLAMHQSFSAAMALLAAFYAGRADMPTTQAALTAHMEATAWHRANLAAHEQPELALNHGGPSHG